MAPEPPADVRIESAEREDADALAARWVELAKDQREHGSHLLPEENRTQIREALLQHVVTDTVLVARRPASDGDEDGENQEEAMVGFVSFGLESERYRQDVRRGIVHNIYVRPADRGVGIGSALLEAAEAALAERGADTVGLQAMASNESARAFYEQNGYAPHRVEYEKTIESDSLTTDDG